MQTSLEDVTLVTWSGFHNQDKNDSKCRWSFKVPCYQTNLMDWFRQLYPSSSRRPRNKLETSDRSLTRIYQLTEWRFCTGRRYQRQYWQQWRWRYRRSRAYQRNFFAREALRLKWSTATSEFIFLALASLSLGFISLKNTEKALLRLILAGPLHLKLRQYPSIEDFLRAITKSSQKLKLLSSEYHSSLNEEHDHIQ